MATRKSRSVAGRSVGVKSRRASSRVTAQMPHIELVSELASPSFTSPTDPDPSPATEPDMPEAPTNVPVEPVQSQYVTSCTNCGHMPLSVNAIVGVLVAIVFTLSSLLVASSMLINSQAFQLRVFNAHGNIGSVAQR